MGKTVKTDLPAHSLLHAYVTDGDFLDCYRIETSLNADQAANQAMTFPVWVKGLMWLRNKVVMPFGLRTDLPDGDTIGIFPVEMRNDSEVIMGFNDRHLDFRISILTDGKHAYGSTWVRRHNWLGHVYLAIIMPFHILIMRNSMRRVKP